MYIFDFHLPYSWWLTLLYNNEEIQYFFPYRLNVKQMYTLQYVTTHEWHYSMFKLLSNSPPPHPSWRYHSLPHYYCILLTAHTFCIFQHSLKYWNQRVTSSISLLLIFIHDSVIAFLSQCVSVCKKVIHIHMINYDYGIQGWWYILTITKHIPTNIFQ